MKVLYFDYWTKGLPHQILPLDRILSDNGFDRILVHLGSWRDKSVKEEEYIEGLLCRDIKYYGSDIRNSIVIEKPSVVYVLNMGGPIDRLVNRICRNLKIKTIFMMHGALPTGIDLILEKRRINRGFSFFYRLLKGFKYWKVYEMYGLEILRNDAREIFHPKIYMHLIQMIFSPGSMYTTPFVDRDLHTDRVLVYSKVYKEEFRKNMRLPSDKVCIVGNPNLDAIAKFANLEDSNFRIDKYYKEIGIPQDKPLLVFLVDGLDYCKGSFSKVDWLNELKEVAEITDELGWRLILKLHPTNDRREVLAYLGTTRSVHVFQMEVDLSIVAGCKAAIGHISSALIVPIVLDKPVLIPKWTKVYAEFDYYISNGGAIPCCTAEEFRKQLVSIKSGKQFDSHERKQFVENNIGPLDGRSWERIAKETMVLAKFSHESPNYGRFHDRGLPS